MPTALPVSAAVGSFMQSSDQATMQSALGLGTPTTIGVNILNLTNPGAITFLRINADNTPSALSASDMRTALGLDTMALQAASNVSISGGSAAFTGVLSTSVAGAVSAPAFKLTGAPYSGGTATTTKPLALIETSGATSTAWNTAGTLLAVNSASGFAGRLVDFQANGMSQISVDYSTGLYLRTIQALSYVDVNTLQIGGNSVAARLAGTERLWVTGGIGFASSYASNLVAYLHVTADTFQFGATSATPSTQSIKGPNGSGTNIAGGKLEVCSGQSTGSATPATLVFRGTAAGSSGTTAQTLVDVMTIVNSTLVRLESGVVLRLGNTAVAATPTATHYVTIEDYTGATLKLLAAT